MVQAGRHDSITTIFALQDFRNLYSSLTLKFFIADGAMDNYPTYALLKYFKVVPFITLDARTKAKLNYPHPDIAGFDDQSRPVCRGEVPFAYWGMCAPYRLKYRCRFKARGLEPPADCRCSDSSYGKTIYIKVDYDPRMFPPVPRSSGAFKERFNTRTTVERTNKRLFTDYAIEEYDSRSVILRAALGAFAAVNMHLDAWIKHKGFSFIDLLKTAVA